MPQPPKASSVQPAFFVDHPTFSSWAIPLASHLRLGLASDKVMDGRRALVWAHSAVGDCMDFRKAFAALTLFSAFSLASCSGLPKTCTTNCTTNGEATLTMTAAPLSLPPGTNLLSFVVTVNTITLTPSTGSPVNIPLNAATFSVDLTKLQSDSVFLGSLATVPAGTYASMSVSLSNPVVTYCTQTSGSSGCAAGSVATFSGGAAAAPVISSVPFPLAITANEQTGLAISLNLNNALTVNASQVVTAVNLAAASVLTASALPSAANSLSPGQLDFVEDVTGIVTAINTSTQSVTVQTPTSGSITAIANSSTIFSSNCTALTLSLSFTSCVVQGQVASLDTALNADGTFTLLEYDPLAPTSGDWIEGIVTAAPTSSTQFEIVTNSLVLATSGSKIGSSLALATPVNVTLVSSNPFLIDSKGLTIPSTTFGGTDASILIPGQTVAVHVTAFTAASGTPSVATASADTLYLRFTRVTGSLTSPASPNTSIQSLPSFFGLSTSVQVGLSAGTVNTNYDGVSSPTVLASGQTASIRALYFGPTVVPSFSAAKVRTH